MNIAFLMKSVPGYFSACVETLAAKDQTRVMMICESPAPDAPFDINEVSPNGAELHLYATLPSGKHLRQVVEAFEPDVVVTAGWQIGPFRYVLKHLPAGTLRVLLMDNQWLGTPKQRVGVLIASRYLHPLYDIAFLPGRNQEVFANKLGFRSRQIWRGAYTCDYDLFASGATGEERHRSFVFVGRLVKEKGIGTLADAYARYRDNCSDPWSLDVYGAGPERGVLEEREGVRLLGFAQPSTLPKVYGSAGCFVLPSLFEPWGTVVHEAAAAGSPIICTTACGSAPHLVEDGANGYLVEPRSAEDLSNAMIKFSALPAGARNEMGEMSSVLARRYTPNRWAELFRERAGEALDQRAGRNE
jgi:glycosyltransferase involved in cell wall biosynthesis